MASPHTEAHSQLGTNSGASALKDAAETPPLGPFAFPAGFFAAFFGSGAAAKAAWAARRTLC